MIRMLLGCAAVLCLCALRAGAAQEGPVRLPEIGRSFSLPCAAIDIQSQDDGLIALEAKDAQGRVIRILLNDQPAPNIYLSSPLSGTDAVRIANGSPTELNIIRILRSWLADKIPPEGQSVKNSPDDRFKIFLTVEMTGLLENDFSGGPDKFEPQYSCYDLHGGYECHVRKTEPEQKPSAGPFDGLDFGCQSDADCRVTEDGSCVTGNVLGDLLGGQTQPDAQKQCRCLKGPVVFGCVPANQQF